MIGALAAVGLAITGDDGRVVQHGEWPDDLSGNVEIEVLREGGIDVINMEQSTPVEAGRVDVGKHLRANRRSGQTVLFVVSDHCSKELVYHAVKQT